MTLTFPHYNRDVSKIESTIQSIVELDRNNYPIIEPDGTKIWYNKEGKRHRVDGPAITHPDGYQVYYQNGKLHNENGPAVIHADGEQQYCQNGLRHRLDGPAIIYADGTEEYWEYGVKIK